MTGICFFFEPNDIDVWSGRAVDLDAWHYASKAFGIDQMAMIDLVGDGLNLQINSSTLFERYKQLSDFEEVHSNEDLLYFETPWSFKNITPTKLTQLIHPENCWYIFGPAAGFQPEKMSPRRWITVPQEGSLQGAHIAMHSVHLASIVLAHRYFQRGS